MSLIIKKMPMPSDKIPYKCPYLMNPTRIVIHNTANDASALNEIKYMQSNTREVSFHYAVDDKMAVQGIDLWRNAWHAGDGPDGVGNRQGIAIEICYSKSGGPRFIKAEQNAAELAAQLLLDFGWGIDKITKHQDYANKYCLPIDETELLTPFGWKNLGDIEEGDVVAQFENDTIDFVRAQHVVEPYKDIVVKTRRIEATLNHDMLYKNHESSHWYKDRWCEVLKKNNVHVPVGGKYDGMGLPISDDYLRFLVWVQADGHYAQRVSKYTGVLHQLGIEFHFSKKRKVDRLLSILDNIEQKYSYRVRTDGTYCIRIHDCTIRERVEEYLNSKQFSWKFIEMSDHQREIFLEEIIHADGSLQNRSYFSTKQQNYDVVSAVAALHNRRCLQTTTGTSTALSFSDSNLTITENSEKSMRETYVSCITVPSGAILIRQYGQPKVVGNCPHRTLDMGWARFVDMVEDKRQELAGIKKKKTVTEATYVEMNGYTLVRANDFSIKYWDKSKKKYSANSYINAGFWAPYKESGVAFTLPVGNLVCDISLADVKPVAQNHLKDYVKGIKLRYSTNDNASLQFHGKKVSTLVLPTNGTPYIDELASVPETARYAISGIPVIRKKVDVSYNNFVLPQGWDVSPFYATSRNFIGLKGSSIWIVTGTSKTTNFVAKSEVYEKLKDFEFDDLIALDGGGSYYYKYNGKAPIIWGDREVNNLVVFG